MDLSSASIKTSGHLPNTPNTRLQGRWLLIARVSWVMLTLLLLTLNMVMIPRYDAVLQAHCQPSPQCFAIQLTAYDRTLLHQFGLSLGFLAAYQIVLLDAIPALIFFALGALIFWRKSANRMALFSAFALVLFGGIVTGILQGTLSLLSPAWTVLLNTLYVLGESSFMIFFFLFPSGRFVPRWTRWIVPCVVLYWTYTVLFTNGNTGQNFWSQLVFVAFLLCAVGVQIYRYRRVSTSRERQQTKWVVFGLSIGIIGFLLVIIPVPLLPPALQQSSVFGEFVGGTIGIGFLMLIPISIAIAILRSRLYDIDTIINKTLVYGLLSALLAAIYVGLILGLQALLGGLLHQTNAIALVVSTLAIAALFLPLRRRIQAVIDRRFYRRKYDAEKILAAFSATLRQEVDLDQLREQLLAVVQETMQPAHVSLWLRPPAHHETHWVPWRANPSVPSEDEAREEG